MAFSPDGRFLAAAARYDAATYIWDLPTLTGTALMSSALTIRECPLAISPDATWLARANDDGTLGLWDGSAASLRAGGTVAPAASLEPHEAPVRILCFSPDSRLLFTVSLRGEVLASEVPSGRPVARASVPSVPSGGAFSPDGRRLAVTVQDTIAIVELEPGSHE